MPVSGGLNLYQIPSGGQTTKQSSGLKITIFGRPRFTPDGQRVALVETTSITLWNTSAGTADDPEQPLWSTNNVGNGEGEFDELGTILAVADFKPLAERQRYLRHPGVTLYETDTGKPLLAISLTPSVVETMGFVPNRPMLITAGADGYASMWDLDQLLADPSLKDLPDDVLWNRLTDPDPAPAYRAAIELDKRKRLSAECSLLAPDLLSSHNARMFDHWIEQLSSPISSVKETAHKQLEHAGPAAAPAVRNAIARHPGSEIEARLSDILRLIQVDGDAPVPQLDIELLRARRAMRCLAWSSDPAAPRSGRTPRRHTTPQSCDATGNDGFRRFKADHAGARRPRRTPWQLIGQDAIALK